MIHSSPAHDKMANADTLEIETEVRGNLIATLQNPVEDANNNTVEITGHLVPEDGSTGKVFFAFTYEGDKDTYECELLPRKAVLAYKKLTNEDDNIIAEIVSNIKETIYEAKKADLKHSVGVGTNKTPAKTSPTRIRPRISEDNQTPQTRPRMVSRVSAQENTKSSEKKKRKSPSITPIGQLGHQISGLKLQINALRNKKAKVGDSSDEYDNQAKIYVKALRDYAKGLRNKKELEKMQQTLDMIDDIANIRDYYQGGTITVSKMNPKTKKYEDYEEPVLSYFANYLRATATYINSKYLNEDEIQDEIDRKTIEMHDKMRLRTDMEVKAVGGDKLEGVQIFFE